MAEKERIGLAQAQSLKIGTVAIPKIAGGRATITGSGTVTLAGFASVSSVVVSIGQADAAAGETVTATSSGNVITIGVWTSTFGASTTPTIVDYIATGS